jgi:hypothetical protein
MFNGNGVAISNLQTRVFKEHCMVEKRGIFKPVQFEAFDII